MIPLIKELIAVLLGGALGSGSRFLLSRAVQANTSYNFPWGIWACNVLGSFVIGILAGLFMHRFAESSFWRAFLMIGLMGGFTTFSSFSLDTVTLFQAGEYWSAFGNIVLSLLTCVGATFFGLMLAS